MKWPHIQFPNPWRVMMTASLPHLKFWALLGASVMLTSGAVGLVWIVWLGGWPVNLRGKQLEILGISLFLVLAGILVVVVALASARLSAQGPGNFRVEVDSDDEPRPPANNPTVTVNPSGDGSVKVEPTNPPPSP